MEVRITGSAPRKRKTGVPLPLVLFGLLIIALRLGMPTAAQSLPDLPASDEPAGAFPLPLEEMLPLQESAALPADQALPVVSAPVFTADGYHSSGTVYFKNETDYAIDMVSLLAQDSPVRHLQIHPKIHPNTHERPPGCPGGFFYIFSILALIRSISPSMW